MLEGIGRAWRVAATGICFAAFGIGGLLLGVALLPAMRLLIRDPSRRRAAARATIHHTFRLLVATMRLSGVLSVEAHGFERIRGGNLILANHPTLIDVVLLMSLVRRCDCIVKASLADNPFTGGPIRSAQFVLNDDSAQLIQDCVQSLESGSNLIVFPEGTRTTPGEAIRLQRGAARIAVHGLRDITPVRIQCTPATLSKGQAWYKVPARRVHIRLDVEPVISVQEFIEGAASQAVAARHLTSFLTEYFSTQSSHASA